MKKNQMIDNPILITGIARSGISLIGKAIHLCGAWEGSPVGTLGREDNPHFGNGRLRELVMKPFMRGIKADPNGQAPLPDIDLCKTLAPRVASPWRQLVETIIRNQGYEQGPWLFMDYRNCLIWPIWAEAFPGARWIIVRRNDDDVIRSCMRTGYMSAHKDMQGWQQWINAHKQRFEEMVEAGLNAWDLWPQEIIKGNLTALRTLIAELGLKWDDADIQNFVTPLMWKAGIFEVKKGEEG